VRAEKKSLNVEKADKCQMLLEKRRFILEERRLEKQKLHGNGRECTLKCSKEDGTGRVKAEG